MPISLELLKIMKEHMRRTMMELIGFLPVEVSKERVLAELPFRDDLRTKGTLFKRFNLFFPALFSLQRI